MNLVEAIVVAFCLVLLHYILCCSTQLFFFFTFFLILFLFRTVYLAIIRITCSFNYIFRFPGSPIYYFYSLYYIFIEFFLIPGSPLYYFHYLYLSVVWGIFFLLSLQFIDSSELFAYLVIYFFILVFCSVVDFVDSPRRCCGVLLLFLLR